jgi:acyl-CoA reductase-like NAD-dependent aldehyde dehydrogenase
MARFSGALKKRGTELAQAVTRQNGMPMAALLNNGQACFNCARVLAPLSCYTQIVDALSSMATSLAVGNAMDPATQVGPMASPAHRQRVETYIKQIKTT